MLKRLTLALLLPSLASGQAVLVVDDTPGPGVDYTSIQDAVDAAGPLDRIEVRHGSYDAFTVTRQATILGADPGAGTVDVSRINCTDVPAGDIVVLADLRASRLSATDCAGVLIADQVVGRGGQLSALRSSDVRVQSRYPGNFGLSTATVTDSFVQLQDIGIAADTSTGSGNPNALECVRSTVYLTDCRVIGGEDTLFNPPGDGIVARASKVRLLGSQVSGGANNLSFPPFPGAAVNATDGSVVIESDSSFFPSAAGVLSEPGLPWATSDGSSAVGGATTINFRAEPGSVLRAYLGRRPVLDLVPGVAVPWTQSRERGVSLGSVPGTGLTQIQFTIPPIPRGTLIHLQSSRTLTTGQTELSNAVTLVVR